MSEANKALQRRQLEEVFNKHNPGAVDQFFAPDYVNHNALPGMPNDREGVKADKSDRDQHFSCSRWQNRGRLERKRSDGFDAAARRGPSAGRMTPI
jgi:hypothetical protein